MKSGAAKRALVVFVVISVSLLAVFVLGRNLLAQSGGEYDLSWSAIVGGGETFSDGGDYVLGAAIGQAGAGSLAGGDYRLEGGFWHCFPLGSPECEIAGAKEKIYIPVIARPNN